jgi:hypothetical protein
VISRVTSSLRVLISGRDHLICDSRQPEYTLRCLFNTRRVAHRASPARYTLVYDMALALATDTTVLLESVEPFVHRAVKQRPAVVDDAFRAAERCGHASSCGSWRDSQTGWIWEDVGCARSRVRARACVRIHVSACELACTSLQARTRSRASSCAGACARDHTGRRSASLVHLVPEASKVQCVVSF